MQGQSSAIDSFPETLEFDHGSSSSDNVNSPSDVLSDYISLNVTNEDDPNADMWNVGEPEPPSSMLSLGDHGSSSSSFSDPSELDDHRVSRKRKASELTTGQSSGIGRLTHLDPIIPRLGLSRISASRTNRSSNLDSISDHSLFAPSSNERNGGQTELNDGESGGAATFRAGTSSGSSPNYHPRRLSAFLRRSLVSATDLEADGGQNSLFPRIPPVLSTSSSSQDIGIPPVSSIQGPRSRSSLLAARQLEGGVAFYPSRTMTGGIERRGRLVSEIRSVLDYMRRGEDLRFEDLMLLDRSVFYGIANNHDRHRDMRLDIDNMSYEELLALEDRIGNVNTGLTEEKILKHLKQKQYVIETGQLDAEPCCICQEEYKDGDDLGTLECGHYFHGGCIKQWLQHKNVCPICKSTGFAAAT